MSGQENLTKKTARALKWNYVGIITKIGLSFGVNTLLVRLLGPRPFGELAVAMIVFGLGNLLSSIGLASALIQKDNLEEADVRFCFTCQMIVGSLLMLGLIASAPLWAVFFHDPKITLLLRVFSILFVLQAFGATSTALLNRKQDAHVIQANTIISYVIAYVGIGIPMALLHCDIWSLVVAWLSQALINSILTYVRSRHSLRPLFEFSRLHLLTFGFRVLAANLCSWGIVNLDNTVVGRTSGPVLLGFYSRAFTLASMADNITFGLLQVLLPAFSRVQQEETKLRSLYASIFGLLLFALLPILAAVSVSADVVVIGLYGKKWAPAIGYVRPIALAMALNAVMAISGPLLAARGRPGREFRSQFVAVVIAVIAYVSSARISVLALSWTVLLVYAIRLFLLVSAVNREIGSRWRDLLECSYSAVVMSVVTAGTAKLLLLVLNIENQFVKLVLVLLGVGVVMMTALMLFGSFFLGPSLRKSPQLMALIPKRFQRIIFRAQFGGMLSRT
ncbi:lipopolysaccharide biosynthesis protein [Terriglobus albidus]|uniref:lipopolysaccharide biosynthesis protein n=1 Tax=Terriglobus albidus TaxID=1592106 RepID=UPI0021DFBC5A|nr:lipopolysaccharide biosynthesis protein [Terriglobus albidus]